MKQLMQGRSRTAAVIAAAAVLLVTAYSPALGQDASAPAGQTGTIGMVEFDTTSPIDKIFADSTRATLEAAGFEVLSQDPKGDPGQANAICSQYVTRQVDAMVVITFALDQMAQCMAQTSEAGIPVVFEGSPLLEGMAGAVDVTAPPPINDIFIKYIVDNGVTDTLALDYSPGTPCRLRAEYREKVLAEQAPNVNESKHEFPIPGQVVDAQNATAAWLAAHPEGSGTFAIWSCFADPTSGAVAALNQVGRSDVPIFTWDFGEHILPAIRNGQVAADLFLDGEAVGQQVAQLVQDALAGAEPKGVVAANVILNKDNIDQFLEENPQVLE